MGRARTFVTDLTHFLTKEGAIAPMLVQARRLAEFLGDIVVAAINTERRPAPR